MILIEIEAVWINPNPSHNSLGAAAHENENLIPLAHAESSCPSLRRRPGFSGSTDGWWRCALFQLTPEPAGPRLVRSGNARSCTCRTTWALVWTPWSPTGTFLCNLSNGCVINSFCDNTWKHFSIIQSSGSTRPGRTRAARGGFPGVSSTSSYTSGGRFNSIILRPKNGLKNGPKCQFATSICINSFFLVESH